MPPKKTETKAEGAAASKTKSSSHASYQDMITDAIVNLKERTGSSRQALKKYVKANNQINATEAMFDSLFNKALKAGVEKGIFEQPKGASGTTKLAKKAKPAVKKEGAPAKKPTAAKKEGAAKKATAKKPAAKKEGAPKKETAKKAAAPKKEKKAAPKKAAAPAVVDKPTVLTKTKSGRVAKTAAKPAAAKKAAPKKAAPKKAAKKADKPAEAAA